MACRLNGLNTGSRFQTGSQTSLPAKNDLITFNFKQRHARLLRALQIGSQHCYPKFAFVQALRPECKLFIARLAATLFLDRKSTRLNSSHANISYAVFCLKKKKENEYCRLIEINEESH